MYNEKQHLYFISNPVTGLVKIGVSAYPEYRRRELEMAAGVSLAVIGVLEDGKQYEEPLHLLFLDRRCLGEWFRNNAEITGLAKNPAVIPTFIRYRGRRLRAARERLLAIRQQGKVPWRSVVLRGDETLWLI